MVDMSKYPWMPTYTKDILLSCDEMTNEEFGAYCRMLFTEWNNGSLSNIPNRLPIGSLNRESLAIVMAKFKKGDDGRLRNMRLEAIRDEFVGAREAQSEGGKKGAKKRWDRSPKGSPNRLPNANHNQSHIQKESQKDTKKRRAPKRSGFIYSVEFDTFWEAYPRKDCGKGAAFASWKKYKPPLEQCLETIDKFKSSKQWEDPQFIPQATTWINQGRWESEPIPEQEGRAF